MKPIEVYDYNYQYGHLKNKSPYRSSSYVVFGELIEVWGYFFKMDRIITGTARDPSQNTALVAIRGLLE